MDAWAEQALACTYTFSSIVCVYQQIEWKYNRKKTQSPQKKKQKYLNSSKREPDEMWVMERQE